MSRIEARPKHLFSWGFDLHTRHGFLTTMDMSWLQEGGAFQWQGATYTLGREGWHSGDFFLQSGEDAVVRATKQSPFLRSFHVHMGDRDLDLKAAAPFTRRFVLVENTSVVGQISPKHLFTRSSVIELPEDMDVPVQVFLFWLVALMWRREANAAAST